MFSRALVRCVAKFPQPFNFQSQIDLANCFFFVVCLFIVKTRKVSSWSDVRHEALEHEINAIVCSLFFFFHFSTIQALRRNVDSMSITSQNISALFFQLKNFFLPMIASSGCVHNWRLFSRCDRALVWIELSSSSWNFKHHSLACDLKQQK